MRTNSIFIAHVAGRSAACSAADGAGDADYPGVIRQTSAATSDSRSHLTGRNQTQPDRLRQNCRAWRAEGRGFEDRRASNRETVRLG